MKIFALLSASTVLFSETGWAQKFDEKAACDAISNSRIVEFRHSDDPDGAERRQIYLHVLGHTKKDSTLVLALQIKGYSKSSDQSGIEPKLPGWRNFRLDRMLDVEVSKETFSPTKPDVGRYKTITSFVCKSSAIDEVAK